MVDHYPIPQHPLNAFDDLSRQGNLRQQVENLSAAVEDFLHQVKVNPGLSTPGYSVE